MNILQMEKGDNCPSWEGFGKGGGLHNAASVTRSTTNTQ